MVMGLAGGEFAFLKFEEPLALSIPNFLLVLLAYSRELRKPL